jgi:hypothetical protein
MPASNPNAARDAHLFEPGPKRLLALDGGGVLGVIEIAFVEQIEALLRLRTGNRNLVLADYYDLIGGTSTGAIIATALALGFTAAQVKRLYFDLAPAIFRRPRTSVAFVGPRFYASGLASKLRTVLGERQLQTEELATGLAIIAKRVDTGSPWVITNNPHGRFWEDPQPDGTGKVPYLGNKRYKLRELLRASTAAPFYFNPKKLSIVSGEPDGLFVDGGLSPHNNPALQMLLLATIKGYAFGWPLGRDRLLLTSIGTGWIRPRISLAQGTRMWSGELAVRALRGVTWDAQVNTLMLLQWMSEPRRPWPINTEVGDLAGECMGLPAEGNELLTFQRYDLAFDREWLKSELDVEMSGLEVEVLNDFMNPSVMQPVYDLARRAAERQVHPEDFPHTFERSVIT